MGFLDRFKREKWYCQIQTTHPDGKTYESIKLFRMQATYDVWKRKVERNEKNAEYRIVIGPLLPIVSED